MNNVKLLGKIYVIIALMVIGMSYALSIMLNIPFDKDFWSAGLFLSSIYWGIGLLVSLFGDL